MKPSSVPPVRFEAPPTSEDVTEKSAGEPVRGSIQIPGPSLQEELSALAGQLRGTWILFACDCGNRVAIHRRALRGARSAWACCGREVDRYGSGTEADAD